MGTDDSADQLFCVEKLTEEELQIQIEFIEKLIRKGLGGDDPFAILEAENRLTLLGKLDPPDDIVELVIKRLDVPSYSLNFDFIRISAYLLNDKIRTVLENHFTGLKVVWREQDELRLYESHRMILENVIRRADELSALRVIADPYMKTMDEFFARHFNEKKLQKFPQLIKIHKNLLRMRKQGALTKDNILAVLDAAKSQINGFIEMRSAELAKKHGQVHIKPNRLIAVYYCLLEALMRHESPLIKIDKEFLEKVAQDFRASYGDGTKRFVLNSLLQLRNDGFAEVAAEARYAIKAKSVEKMQRRDAGEPGFRAQKFTLREFQNHNLYQTAAKVISLNPKAEVLRSLMYSYNPPALLLGLHALELAELPVPVKVGHLKVMFDLGTMDDYVFTRAIKILSSISSPGAAAVLARLIVERYGWRKARIPTQALAMIDNAIYGTDVYAVAALGEALSGSSWPDTKIEPTFPYEGKVYDSAFDQLATRFERNIFHGVNELGQHRLFRGLLNVVFRTRLNFAMRGKRRALAAIRALHQVSEERLGAMIDELKSETNNFEKEVVNKATESERPLARDILTDARNTQVALAQFRAQVPKEEKVLIRAAQALSRFFSIKEKKEDVGLQLQLNQLFDQLSELGYERMSKRNKNILAGTDKWNPPDTAMLALRYPAASSTLIRASRLVILYGRGNKEDNVKNVVRSLGVAILAKPTAAPDPPPSEKEIFKVWKDLKSKLGEILPREEALKHQEKVAAVTAGATAHGLGEVLEDMVAYLYENRQRAELRYAHLAALPLEKDFAKYWSYLLGCEEETVFLALATHFNSEKRAALKSLVPDLLDLLD